VYSWFSHTFGILFYTGGIKKDNKQIEMSAYEKNEKNRTVFNQNFFSFNYLCTYCAPVKTDEEFARAMTLSLELGQT